MLVECAPLALPHAFAINNTHNTFAYTHYTDLSDYLDTRQNLTFSSEGSQSVSIPIIDDFVVEDTESFLALLSSSDNFVLIGQELADVFIQDDDGNYVL